MILLRVCRFHEILSIRARYSFVKENDCLIEEIFRRFSYNRCDAIVESLEFYRREVFSNFAMKLCQYLRQVLFYHAVIEGIFLLFLHNGDDAVVEFSGFCRKFLVVSPRKKCFFLYSRRKLSKFYWN